MKLLSFCLVILLILVNYVSCNIEDSMTVAEPPSTLNFMERFNEIERKVERFNEMERKIEKFREMEIKLNQFKDIDRKMTAMQSKNEENEAKFISEILLLKEKNRILQLRITAIEKKTILEKKELPITSNIYENESSAEALLNNAVKDNTRGNQESTLPLDGFSGNNLVQSGSTKSYYNRASRIVLSDGEGPVAFCATFHAQAQEQHLGTNQVITYDKLITNIGGGFHMAHGLFTAPQSGIYLLSSSVLSHVNNRVIAGIVINGVPVAQMYAYYAGNSDQGSQTIIVQLHLPLRFSK